MLQSSHNKTEIFDSVLVELQILDTNGSGDFGSLQKIWMRNKDAFILVFSLTENSHLE